MRGVFCPHDVTLAHTMTEACFKRWNDMRCSADTGLPRRIMFCNWFSSPPPGFVTNLIVTDEAAFHMDGLVNKQNTKHHSEKNSSPIDIKHDVPFDREKVSVWAGLCGNSAIIGPIFYQGNLNSFTNPRGLW
ncbi:hypothetical protein FHG87_020181 [Trinorchestia longiramus]|nr:hypothetical protein FHG87_020181 [Trinorchestia longiramus]